MDFLNMENSKKKILIVIRMNLNMMSFKAFFKVSSKTSNRSQTRNWKLKLTKS